MKLLGIIILIFNFHIQLYAGKIFGKITDDKEDALPFATVSIKGTTKGTNANKNGEYFLNLLPGKYTLVCQYVGFGRIEKNILVDASDVEINFTLSPQNYTLPAVVINNAVDPAYEMIRKTIKKRVYYLNQISELQYEVYTKGVLKLIDFPKKFMGQKIDFEDGDTGKNRMIFLSETISSVSIKPPNQVKIVVTSSKVSGRSDDFGLAAPTVFSFYQNNISITKSLNPRGFISPISDHALQYYKYKYEGSFTEEGKIVLRIKVIPRRKFEPLFSGYINIIDDDWRIHSLQLYLVKDQQLQTLDSLRIEQLYIPFNKDLWLVKSQLLFPSAKKFGFNVKGSFANTYYNFDINPHFTQQTFNQIILKYTDSSNKKNLSYWEAIRPIPLQPEEINDYRKKDSFELVKKNPHYIDSIDRLRNKLTLNEILIQGKTFSNQKKKMYTTWPSILETVNYNTIEGLNIQLLPYWYKKLNLSDNSRNSISLQIGLRYGFSNHNFNAHVATRYIWGNKYFHNLTISGGKNNFQFNNNNPVSEKENTISTLRFTRNFLKLYSAWYLKTLYSYNLGNGLALTFTAQYQYRMPLKNTSDYVFKNISTRVLTPNYPTELTTQNLIKHQAFYIGASLNWQPGAKYIEFPGKTINVGSKYPTINLGLLQAIPHVFGSSVAYTKFNLALQDDINLKLFGKLNYRFKMGIFLNRDSVALPDYYHFNGNQMAVVTNYLNTFQLMPYYEYSNMNRLNEEVHVEYHLNGLLTNKVPFIRKLNWFLLTGANALNTQHTQYVEAFVGIENILKIYRVDFIHSFKNIGTNIWGVRIGANLKIKPTANFD